MMCIIPLQHKTSPAALRAPPSASHTDSATQPSLAVESGVRRQRRDGEEFLKCLLPPITITSTTQNQSGFIECWFGVGFAVTGGCDLCILHDLCAAAIIAITRFIALTVHRAQHNARAARCRNYTISFMFFYVWSADNRNTREKKNSETSL